jgi:hypothetical protein
MVAHLSIPSLDSTRNLPSTLSKPIVTGLLKNELGFQGLAFTDAMNMQGVTKHFPPGVADMRAILAGNDVLEYTADIPRAISEIKKAVRNGLISQEEIDARCRKVLAAKAWVGLSQYKPVDLTNLVADLNPPEAQLLNRQLSEAALTVLTNRNNFIPVRQLDTLKVAAVSVGVGSRSDFSRMLGKYTDVDAYNLSAGSSAADLGRVKAQLGKYNLVVVGIHVPSIRPGRNYGITPAMITAVRELAATGKAVAVLLGNPYTLNKFTGLEGRPGPGAGLPGQQGHAGNGRATDLRGRESQRQAARYRQRLPRRHGPGAQFRPTGSSTRCPKKPASGRKSSTPRSIRWPTTP